MRLEIMSKSENEALARVTVAAFAAQLDPNLEEISDIKTAVSEAVTNSIIHGYGNESGLITLVCELSDREIIISVIDRGKGIEDIEAAVAPLYTTAPEEERAGMGFTVMEAFMDEVEIKSSPGAGTTVVMKKYIGGDEKR